MREYHPRRSEKEITDKAELNRLLREGKYTVIGMAIDNEPYVVSLSYGYDEAEGCLYFHCAPVGEKIDYLKANPEVCATIVEDRGYVKGECKHVYSSLVIRGRVDILPSVEEKRHGLQILLKHLENDPDTMLKQYSSDEKSYDAVGVLRLKITSISGKKHSVAD